MKGIERTCIATAVALTCTAAVAGTAPKREAAVVRLDFQVGIDPPIRITRFVDMNQLTQGVIETWDLYQVGSSRFVNVFSTDRRIQERNVELRGEAPNERIRFARSAKRTGLTASEWDLKFGLLSTSSLEFKVRLEDASRRTVARRLERIWDDWRPSSRVALKTLYETVISCAIPVPQGDVLNLLFAGVMPRQCTESVKTATPDPSDDRAFLLILPDLQGVFARPRIAQPQPETPGAGLQVPQ